MKRKPRGWENEPYRHSLAAHGVITRNQCRVQGIPNQRVNIHGMDVSRWRCPECYRGLRGGDTCSIHGRVHKQGVDITRSPLAQDYAIYYRITNELSKERGLSVRQLAKRTGINELILIEHLDKVDPYDGKTYREAYTETYGLRSKGNKGYTMDELEGTIYDYIKSKNPSATHDNIAMSINNMSMVQKINMAKKIKRDHFWENTKTYNGEKYVQANRDPIAKKSDAMKLLKSYQKRGHGAHLEGGKGNWTIYVTRYAGKGPLLP